MKNISLLYYQNPQSGITEPNKLQHLENLRHENTNNKKILKRKKSQTYQSRFKMRNFKANFSDLHAKNSVSNGMLLSQVRCWIFEYAGGNSAGPKRHCYHSLHEYKRKPPTEFWKQALGGIRPHKCFWRVPGVLDLPLCWLCSVPLSTCCVWPLAHLP